MALCLTCDRNQTEPGLHHCFSCNQGIESYRNRGKEDLSGVATAKDLQAITERARAAGKEFGVKQYVDLALRCANSGRDDFTLFGRIRLDDREKLEALGFTIKVHGSPVVDSSLDGSASQKFTFISWKK